MPEAHCSRCGAANPADVKFCGQCGAKFVPVPPAVEVPGEDGLYYCSKHRKTTTRVTCGRCERPICDRCMVVGANGVRCRECARNKVPVRLSGVLHDAGRSIGGTANSLGTRPIWYLWIWSMIIRFILGLFGR